MNVGNLNWNGDEGGLSKALRNWMDGEHPILVMDACDDWIWELKEAKKRASERFAQRALKARTANDAV